MMSIAKILFFVSLFVINIALLWAQCNSCSATTQMACVSENQYQFCVNNLPSGAANSCPTGYICSTATSVTCQLSTSGFAATCGSCNVCNTNRTFACTGSNTYALCLNTTVPSATAIGSCGTGLVCNVNLPQMCGNPATGTAATCSTGTTTNPTLPSLTTPSPLPTYAQYLCQTVRINGRFSLPTEIDNTCRRYLYCFLNRNGTWSGQIYTCAGSTYFDSYSRYCVATRPTGC